MSLLEKKKVQRARLLSAHYWWLDDVIFVGWRLWFLKNLCYRHVGWFGLVWSVGGYGSCPLVFIFYLNLKGSCPPDDLLPATAKRSF